MPSIEIKPAIKVGMDEILDGISHLETPDLEKFLTEVGHLLARRKVKTLSKGEAELLLKINQSVLSPSAQEEYTILYEKLREEAITPEEHQQLLKLIEEREKKGVKKMTYLVELAQLRKISLDVLMAELGISALSHV